VTYKRFYVLVEGKDDERFFKRVITPLLEKQYDFVDIYKYSQAKDKKIRGFINSIQCMKAKYVYITDNDCVKCYKTQVKSVLDKHDCIDVNDIVVVIQEIESWYLAGLDKLSCKKLGIKDCVSTIDVTKEDFDRLKPKKFDSRTDFMQEVLKYFDIDTGKHKNASFKYFLNTFCG